MKATTTQITKVALELNLDEAQWLKEIVQNPVQLNDYGREDERDNAMRRLFWDSLREAGV